MESRALGKGLSALIPQKGNLSSEQNVTNIDVNLIKDNTVQPRINYDSEKLNELKASIKEKGVLQPILVRQSGSAYEVVAGERRLRASRALGLETIPVIVKELSDKEALVIALIENIQREDLSPIEEALGFRRLIDEFTYTHEEVAQAVGKERSTVTNFLRLLNLPEDIQKSVSEGKISMGHARTLLSVEDEDKQKILFIETVARGLSVRELEKLVKEPLGGSIKPKKGSKIKDHNIVTLEEDLQKSLGTKVSVLAKKNKGKIVIEYYSLDDLDRILRIVRP
jgi:ParB family chromosome partitioning protein